MTENIKKLLDISSNATGESGVDLSWLSDSKISQELCALLSQKNGFFCFESSLHFFPASEGASGIPALQKWNEMHTWKFKYKDELLSRAFCFAEDVFGQQFVEKDDHVMSFDPETGEFEIIASSIDDFVRAVLNDYNVLTGYSLGHEWQAIYGRLKPSQRLVPKIPFVAGGEFIVSNLYSMDRIESMKMRGELACQIRNLPDGAKIRFSTS